MSETEFTVRMEQVIGPLDGRHVIVMTEVDPANREKLAQAWFQHFNEATLHIEVEGTEMRAARLIPLLIFVSDPSEIEHLPEHAMNQHGWYKHPVNHPGFPIPKEAQHDD